MLTEILSQLIKIEKLKGNCYQEGDGIDLAVKAIHKILNKNWVINPATDEEDYNDHTPKHFYT